ncbi:tetratricopeptide repeat protein [Achromobacter xylosoxidans]|uniref:tetratricopeptide repeat protein n=1 Tax=Alcaligenes xylosoxydans xylosoxydans TaxID=85698 RepID=UPI003F5D8030
MKPLTRSFLLSAALACAGHAGPAAAQSAPRAAEAPLEGAAYQFADEGYKSYDAGNYARAQQQAESAIALRPDVERLRLLLVYALQKQGKLREADKAAADAIKSGLDTPALRQARANLRPRTAPAAAAGGGAPGTTAADPVAYSHLRAPGTRGEGGWRGGGG